MNASKQILIVDDEADIREILGEMILKDFPNVKITHAIDGLDAFLKIQDTKFDLICLDHMMPHFRGADFLIALREKENLNRTTSVIMVSAYIPEIPNSVKSLDNTLFMEKPIDFTRLIRNVKMYLL